MSEFHPVFMGLLHALPPIGQRVGPKRRAALHAAFVAAIDAVYPPAEDNFYMPPSPLNKEQS